MTWAGKPPPGPSLPLWGQRVRERERECVLVWTRGDMILMWQIGVHPLASFELIKFTFPLHTHSKGSGKSSLLNALAGRVAFVKGARLEGQVFLNGAAIDYALMPKICGAWPRVSLSMRKLSLPLNPTLHYNTKTNTKQTNPKILRKPLIPKECINHSTNIRILHWATITFSYLSMGS